MKKVNATALDEHGEHWKAECPECGNELEFKGWFDSSDIVECECGLKFQITKVWLNEKEYIK